MADHAKVRFAQMSYEDALWALSTPSNVKTILPKAIVSVSLYGAAQAALECDWGRSRGYLEHNNPLGIKPVGDQAYAGDIRIFPTRFDAWASWAYLVCKSSHYEWCRRLIDGSKGKVYMSLWATSFSKKYCPGDNHYVEKIGKILQEFDGFNLRL